MKRSSGAVGPLAAAALLVPAAPAVAAGGITSPGAGEVVPASEVLASPASEPAAVQPEATPAVPDEAPAVVPAASPSAAPERRSAPDQAGAFTRAFGTGRGTAAAARPAPRGAPPALPAQPDGTFGTELGYGAPDVVLATPRTPANRAQEALASLPAGERVRLLLLSSLMVGAAVWLRRWARRAIAD